MIACRNGERKYIQCIRLVIVLCTDFGTVEIGEIMWWNVALGVELIDNASSCHKTTL